MEAPAEFKLPMLGKSMRLERLPGQDSRHEYGVIWSACREPGEGWGYVFEFTGKRTGRILAWLTRDGAAYASDGPLAHAPEGQPALLVSYLPNDRQAGKVEARADRGLPLRVVSHFHRVSQGDAFVYDLPTGDVGPYAGRTMDFRTFLAVGFLSFVHIPKESGAAVARGLAESVVDELLEPPLPDACDLLVHRVHWAPPESVSGFERYAARLLEEADSARLRGIAAHASIETGRLSSTGLVWMRFDESALDKEERAVVVAVESVLNRLTLMGDSACAADGPGDVCGGYDESSCSQRDWQVLCNVASEAAKLVRGSASENTLGEVFGVQAAQGGEWDVRTRFAQACEMLRLPYRLEYRFDVDAAAGVVDVECSAPLPEAFPAHRWDAAFGAWMDMRGLRGWAASAYAMRLSAVIAAAAFGAGVGIMRACVTVRAGGLDEPAGMSLAFDRIPFVAEVLPRIEEGALSNAAIACDPAAVLALLAPADRSTAFRDNGFFGVVQPLATGLANRRCDLWEDERALPAHLVDLLRAEKASELDVLHDEDAELTARVSAVIEEGETSPLASIALLEELAAQVDQLERERAAADAGAAEPTDAAGDGARVPLYCANPSARALVGLHDGDACTRYRKASDAGFVARSGLSRLYLQIGDVPRALEAAEACRTLAPSSVPAYLDMVTARVEEGRFDEVEGLLRTALRFVFNRGECSYLCYRLAYALWMQERFDAALACYAAVVDGGGAMADQAESEMNELMEQRGVRERPSSEAVADVLRAEGISATPPREVSQLLAKAAVGLADAGILTAAAPLALAVAQMTGDDALTATANSLRSGVQPASPC